MDQSQQNDVKSNISGLFDCKTNDMTYEVKLNGIKLKISKIPPYGKCQNPISCEIRTKYYRIATIANYKNYLQKFFTNNPTPFGLLDSNFCATLEELYSKLETGGKINLMGYTYKLDENFLLCKRSGKSRCDLTKFGKLKYVDLIGRKMDSIVHMNNLHLSYS